MSRPLLAIGAKGNYVEELQKLLNKWLEKRWGNDAETLDPDKDFGTFTKEAVEDFQFEKHLFIDGIVGNLTWSALLGTETYNYFDKPIYKVKARDKYTCWAAASATLLRQAVPLSRTPGVDFETQPNGSVGGIKNSHANMNIFANKHNMRMFKAEQVSDIELIKLLGRYGRLMLNMKGVDSNMKNSSPEDSHLINLIGARGDGSPGGTTLTVWNPSNGGEKIVRSYRWFKSKFPRMRYQVFYTFGNSSSPL